MSEKNTTLGLKESTKRNLEPLKEASEATTWDGFVNGLVEDNLNVSLEEMEAQEVETHERVEQTRATVIGVLEAVDEADMTDEIVDIIKSLSEQNMLAQNQDILEHLMEKSRRGQPVNDVDRLLAQVVMETEGSRKAGQSPAAVIAQGLFSGKEHRAAERTRTEREETVESATVSEDNPDVDEEELGSDLFTGVERASDDSSDMEPNFNIAGRELDGDAEDDE